MLPLGAKATLVGGVAFLLAIVLAIADSANRSSRGRTRSRALMLVIWLIPIKVYALPVELPFNLEPYRLFLLALVFAWVIQIVVRRGRLEAAGRGRPDPAADRGRGRLDDPQLRQPRARRPTSRRSTRCSTSSASCSCSRSSPRRSTGCRTSTRSCGCSSSARPSSRCSRSTRRARRYNFFDHLSEFVPILDRQEREVLELARRPAARARLGAAPDRDRRRADR